MADSLRPRQSFDWTRVGWEGPDETPGETCSYCDAAIPEDAVPLILFREDGWCARFCDACMQSEFGFAPLPPDPDWDEL